MGEGGWIKYGWGEDLNLHWSNNAPLIIDLTNGGVIPKTSSAVVDAVATVKDIVKNYPAPYSLMCSGGADSQAMLWAWYLSGVKFQVVTVKYVTGSICFNDHDAARLIEFTSKYNIEYIEKEFDVIKFMMTDLRKVALENDCHSPQICTHIEMTKLIDKGTIIFSGNFISDVDPSMLNYTILGMHRHSIKCNTPERKIIPFFFKHTPVIAYTFKTSPQLPRVEAYIKKGFPIIPQEKKLTGFEVIKDYYNDNAVPPKLKLKHSSRASHRAFDIMFRYELEDTRNVDDRAIVINKII